MTSKEFWNYVEEEKARLIADHKRRAQKVQETGDQAHFEGQPENGRSLYLVSKPGRGSSEKPAVVEVAMRLAAQRIVELSHDVAAADQIADFLKRQIENSVTIRHIDQKYGETRSVKVQPADVPKRKLAS